MPASDLSGLAAELLELRPAIDLARLPRSYGEALGAGTLRAAPEDFRVVEHTGVQLCGEGEHLYVRLRKTGQNTRWLAKELARFAGVPYKSVSYAGLKDRHAVTEQTFSLHLPGMPDPDWDALAVEGVQVLDSTRHDRKLRQGQLSYNSFSIILRDCVVNDAELLQHRVAMIAEHGVPNYFGAQRFGRKGGNLDLALGQPVLRRLPREQRSFALSALRSALFNGYLARRVADASWVTPLDGEALLSDRPRGVAEDDESVFTSQRLPAGALWGKSLSGTGGAVRAAEEAWFGRFPGICAALEAAGCRLSRRVLCARVANFVCRIEDGAIRLDFSAGPGVFATVVLRELFDLQDAALEFQD